MMSLIRMVITMTATISNVKRNRGNKKSKRRRTSYMFRSFCWGLCSF